MVIEKRKFIKVKRTVRCPSNADIVELVSGSGWPLVEPDDRIKSLTTKTLLIRPQNIY
jgi:hypothetical protein